MIQRGARRAAGRASRGRFVVLCAILACALAACGKPGAPNSRRAAPVRSVVLVTLDTFRADHLGCAGHPAVRTPRLDRLARRGAQWTEAVSAIPLTTPSHATILTGLTPRTHGVLRNRAPLDTARTTIAETLAARGVRAAAIVSNGTVLAPILRLDQGFHSYEVIEPKQIPASGEGEETARVASEFLARESSPGLFLWAHFFDAHLPYLPPPPFDRLALRDFGAGAARDTAALYAGEIAFLDACVGSLAQTIEESGAASHTTIVVTADHGEGLGEKNDVFGHDVQLYETSLRVPLLISGGGESAGGVAAPGEANSPGRLVREPARTTDLAPTILGIFGLRREERPPMEGRDLLADPPPFGDALSFVVETHPSREKSAPLYAVRTGTAKVIWDSRQGRREYYDLTRDPDERDDLSANPPDPLRVLGEDLELDLRNRPVGRAPTVDELAGGVDESTRAALESLGYVD